MELPIHGMTKRDQAHEPDGRTGRGGLWPSAAHPGAAVLAQPLTLQQPEQTNSAAALFLTVARKQHSSICEQHGAQQWNW